MTNEERLKHYRRWQSYVARSPRRFRIKMLRSENSWLCGLQEHLTVFERYTRTFLGGGRIEARTAPNCGGWCAIEILPEWNLGDADARQP